MLYIIDSFLKTHNAEAPIAFATSYVKGYKTLVLMKHHSCFTGIKSFLYSHIPPPKGGGLIGPLKADIGCYLVIGCA
jgi:hypothetical protein